MSPADRTLPASTMWSLAATTPVLADPVSSGDKSGMKRSTAVEERQSREGPKSCNVIK